MHLSAEKFPAVVEDLLIVVEAFGARPDHFLLKQVLAGDFQTGQSRQLPRLHDPRLETLVLCIDYGFEEIHVEIDLQVLGDRVVLNFITQHLDLFRQLGCLTRTQYLIGLRILPKVRSSGLEVVHWLLWYFNITFRRKGFPAVKALLLKLKSVLDSLIFNLNLLHLIFNRSG